MKSRLTGWARGLAVLGLAAVASTAMAQAARPVSGSGATQEMALRTLRGNAISYCTLSGPGGFDMTDLTCTEGPNVPKWVCRASYSCNGSQPQSREEWLAAAAPR